MRLLLLVLSLFSSVFGVELIESFDCGPEQSTITMKVANATLKKCPIVRDSFNMCCKDHDYCYSVHELHNFTREFCDARFCGCLHDAEDLLNNNVCDLQQNLACNLVRGVGGFIYNASHPAKKNTATDAAKKYQGFKDGKPLGFDMQKLVDACPNAKGMAVHCHNAVYHCLEKEGDRKKNGTLARHSHEDCKSIMYECLQIIGDSNDTEPCPSLARHMAAQYTVGLSVSQYGKAAIEIYPIISERLIANCQDAVGIEMCLDEFNECAAHPLHREERPDYFNAARRVKIVCHQILRQCINSTVTETTDSCIEAKNLALSRIRENAYEKMCLIESLEEFALRLMDFVKKAPARAGTFIQKQLGAAADCMGHPIDCAKDAATSIWQMISKLFKKQKK